MEVLVSISKNSEYGFSKMPIKIDETDGQIRILDDKGLFYTGKWNIEQLLYAKSPRIPLTLEWQCEIIIYTDMTEFYLLDEIEGSIFVGSMRTIELLNVFRDWKKFLEDNS